MNNIAYKIFDEMRCLTPEENEKKRNMYRRMSTSLDVNYFIEKLSFAASNGFTLDTKEDIEELASFLSDEINKEW